MESIYLLAGTIIGLLKIGLEGLLIFIIHFIFYQITGINLVKPVVKLLFKTMIK